MSDLVDKLTWARDHDAEAERIAQNALRFAEEHLLPKNVFCYHGVLLQKLSDLIKVNTDDSLLDEMEELRPEESR